MSYRLDIKKGFRGKWQYHETYSGQGSKELAKADEKFMQKKGYRTRIKKY